MSRFWMVAYDIEDDRIRYCVRNVLKDYGTPVQYSVFECRLSHSQFCVLRARLTSLIEPQDSLRWYPLCRWCRNAVYWQGQGKASEEEGFVIA